MADLLSALKGKGSPHLFGFTSVICGAVRVVRDPPIWTDILSMGLGLTLILIARVRYPSPPFHC